MTPRENNLPCIISDDLIRKLTNKYEISPLSSILRFAPARSTLKVSSLHSPFFPPFVFFFSRLPSSDPPECSKIKILQRRKEGNINEVCTPVTSFFYRCRFLFTKSIRSSNSANNPRNVHDNIMSSLYVIGKLPASPGESSCSLESETSESILIY